jgi:uncharacterized protein YmfQ (DUF2313 family)
MVALRTPEQYREQLQALLPVGPAWDPELAPEIDAILGGMATELARIEGRVVDLVGEMDPATTAELLGDWERVAGLPDKCAGTLETTVQGRRNALLAKLNATGGQSKAYFIALAAALGYQITIEEFHPFQAGRAAAGDILTNGGWRFTWRVHAPEVTVIPFRAGRSAAGEQLRAWGNDTLVCKLRQLAPAHTVVLFAYGNSSLDLLFTSGTYLVKQQAQPFSSVVNFTRASTGSYLDAAGVLQTAAIDAPRFEFSAAGAPLGLLFEQQRTNLALQSADFGNAAWSKSGVTIAPSAVVAPDGTLASKMVESVANATHGLSQAGKVVTGNTKYCRYVFAKADGSGRLLYLETDSFAQWVNSGSARFNLDNGTIDNASPGLDGVGIQPYPNGWYLCWLTATTIASPVAVPFDIQLATSGSPSYAGDGVSGAYIWGAQLEAGDGPSSYIPTLAAPVTRAADLAHVPAAGWLQSGEGTLFAEIGYSSVPVPGVTEVIGATLGTTSTVGRVVLSLANANLRAGGHTVTDANATVFVSTLGEVVLPGQVVKQAIVYGQNYFQFSTAGLASALDTAGELPTIDRLVLGARGIANNHVQGHLRRIRYYPRRLSESELISLTTP